MDFRKLSKAIPQTGQNASETISLTDLPPNILDTLIPGYSIISRYLAAVFGVDISLFVSVAVISFAVLKGGQILYSRLWHGFRYLFVSSVYIDEHDDLFDMMMDWLSATQLNTSRRSVRAKTQRGNKAAANEIEADASNSLDEDGMFDFNKWSARTPPRYEPYYGRYTFWHNSRPFLLRRQQKQQASNNLQVRFGQSAEDDLLQIDCMGRSVEPIRDLLRTVKVWSLNRQRNTTTIRHPTPKDRARFGGAWSKTYSRPSRPMDTVILDVGQKDMIVQDMNEYLHPASPRWYATRGIPYRRGYLFHGPPGTGKTSLSFALAGIFGLEIYCISLQEPTLTEGDLMQLFNGLPRRCIVLLEDVDAAGLIRDEKTSPSGHTAVGKKSGGKRGGKKASGEEGGQEVAEANRESEKKKDVEEEYTLKDLARELKAIGGSKPNQNQSQGQSHRQPGTGISLSGLLNAIDGVASHEGRVLIMTTNHPDKLDAALVRPGRVDRRVSFGLARGEQIRELFARMYSAEEDISALSIQRTSDGNGAVAANGHYPEKPEFIDRNGPVDRKHRKPNTESQNNLDELAAEFAAQVPDDTFTPAEIQNHLMRYKKEPAAAVEKVHDWVSETLAEKDQIAKDTAGERESDDEDVQSDSR